MFIDYDRVAQLYDYYVTADHDIRFYLSEMSKVTGDVLELAAGTGRVSLPLAQAGGRLTCVDVSPGMLEVLSRKLNARGLRAEVLQADVCELKLEPRFHLAIFPFQSFMEIVRRARQRKALSAVWASLVPGGRFICTLHNPAVRRAQVDGQLRVVGRFPTPEGTLVVSGLEVDGQPVVRRLQYFEVYGPDGGLQSRQALPMEFAFVEQDQFAGMANDAGFTIADLYGDYDRSAFDPPTSPVMIWMLQRPRT